ncbi:hypothetical protein PTMSG1_01615 [Pyrenophora teres f. maculata]|nr:hypothetical protein PTMSG1_01615 [Pyrenophora teres f. maculata]
MERALYPLRDVSYHHLQRLGEILWDWKFCGKCSKEPTCLDYTCSWSQAGPLEKFWACYKKITGAYSPDFLDQTPYLKSHDQLLCLVKEMKIFRSSSREFLTQRFFDNNHPDPSKRPTLSDQRNAINIATWILLLTSCGPCRGLIDPADDSYPMIPWRDGVSLQDFVGEAFPKRIHPYFDLLQDRKRVQDVLSSLKAPRLQKDASIRFTATADIRQHLSMDLKQGTVQLFDCTAVLKEILMATLHDSNASILPRALVLETLHTIHDILFPSDTRSQTLLSTLVHKNGFDADLLQYELARFQREDDSPIDYSYFGTRLADIYDELQNPTPRHGWENWFQKYSAQRYMLMATMIGVFIAVVVGILGLGISGFQAYVSYQQWKHPVNDA